MAVIPCLHSSISNFSTSLKVECLTAIIYTFVIILVCESKLAGGYLLIAYDILPPLHAENLSGQSAASSYKLKIENLMLMRQLQGKVGIRKDGGCQS